ncbi:hypothetical protein MNR01_01830 [Lysobacter sp. S4-A87]|uniref:hypothetical protein n=1 Tax=Lysobacter sp. S4-A87 TaxID=2925843 RepID=UPI001F5300E2|nr:hypothetical protein [Lysobacter sp. S4-A87]UNK49802.1 hypothetical protein MNR01_01830 [Lysobacter sp. S4-A87]
MPTIAAARSVQPRSSANKPDAHLELTLATARADESELLRALLRVDLGARIQIDLARRSVRIEGRFWGDDVVSAIEATGCHVDSVNERPRTMVLATVHQAREPQRPRSTGI